MAIRHRGSRGECRRPRVGRFPDRDRNSARQIRHRSVAPPALLLRPERQAKHRAPDSPECQLPYRVLPGGRAARGSPCRDAVFRLKMEWRWPCFSGEHSRIIMTRKSEGHAAAGLLSIWQYFSSWNLRTRNEAQIRSTKHKKRTKNTKVHVCSCDFVDGSLSPRVGATKETTLCGTRSFTS